MEKGNQGCKKGLWTAEEDDMLMDYVKIHGKGHWNSISRRTGLKRSGKSCRLRWINYLNPGIKKGHFTEEEEDLIIRLHRLLGNRWSLIAGRIPGRTDNQIKNYWNTHLSKKLGIKKETSKTLGHAMISNTNSNNPNTSSPTDSSKNSGNSKCDRQSPLHSESHPQNFSCGVSLEDSNEHNSDTEVKPQQAITAAVNSGGYITNSSFWMSEYDGLMGGGGTNPGCFMDLLDGNCFNLDWNP